MNQGHWKTKFGLILKAFFDIYGVSDEMFSEYSEMVLNQPVTASAVRKWFAGTRLPNQRSLQIIFRYFESLNELEKDTIKKNRIYEAPEIHLSDQHLREYYRMRQKSNDVTEFIQGILQYCISNARLKEELNCESVYCPSNKTKVVVFDFDGTLTKGKTNQTTWESIWTSLGYSISDCQQLQLKFIRGEISHDQWCKLTEEKFIERNLHKSQVEDIARRIKLLSGVKDTFAMLEEKNIKIYIVSGSIFDVIKKVLSDALYHSIVGIKANHFFYDDSGILSRIVGTRYDFEGKADFLREIAAELCISTKDILFIGNSFNDRFAYQSGARTLCINPRETDPTDLKVWNYCIKQCSNLEEIMKYVDHI